MISSGLSAHSDFDPNAYQTAKKSVAWHLFPLDMVRAWGNDRLDLLQRLTTNDVLKLSGKDQSGSAVQQGVQNILLTEKARIIDIFTILARENDLLLLFSNEKGETAREWLDKYTFIDDFQTENLTSNYASFLVFGVRALQLLEELTGASLVEIRTSNWIQTTLPLSMSENGTAPEVCEVIIVKQPPLCEFAYSVIVPEASKQAFIRLLTSLPDVAEVNEATFETLRIEAAWLKPSADIKETTNPLEAGLVGLVDFKKGCYIGQEVIARLDTYNKVKVRQMGFIHNSPIPTNARLVDESVPEKQTDIGEITSTTFSPELGKYIALGYIRSQFANPSSFVTAVSNDEHGVESRFSLEMVKLPFVM